MKTILTAKRAFTMIELMVGVAIIGLLSAIVLTSLSTARAKTRDATRLQDLRQIQTALETHRTERGTYPVTGNPSDPEWRGTCAGFGGHANSGTGGWIPGLAPTYIAVLPNDPRPIPPNNCYVYRSTGSDYMVIAYQTVETRVGAANPAPRPSMPSEADFAFFTPGARMW